MREVVEVSFLLPSHSLPFSPDTLAGLQEGTQKIENYPPPTTAEGEKSANRKK